MQTDYRIVFQPRGVTVGEMLTTQQSFDEIKQRKQAERDQKLAWETLRATDGDLKAAYKELQRQGRYDLASAMQQSVSEGQQKVLGTLKSELEVMETVFSDVRNTLHDVDDDTGYQSSRQVLSTKYGDQVTPYLPETYDPEQVRAIVSGGIPLDEQYERRQAAIKRLDEAPKRALESTKDLATVMAGAADAEDWKWLRGLLVLFEVTPEAMAFIPEEYSPESQQQMVALSLGPEKIAEERRKQTGEVRTQERHESDLATAELNREFKPREFGLQEQAAALAGQREARLGATAPEGGADAAGLRTARATRDQRLYDLGAERRARNQEVPPEYGEPGHGMGQMDDAEFAEREREIENLYRRQVGMAPIPAPPSEAEQIATIRGAQRRTPGAGGDEATPAGRPPIAAPPRAAAAGTGPQLTESGIRSVLTTAGVEVTDPAIQRFAAYRDQIRTLLTDLGKDTSDKSIAVFLASKKNRELLGIK